MIYVCVHAHVGITDIETVSSEEVDLVSSLEVRILNLFCPLCKEYICTCVHVESRRHTV